MIRFMLMLAFKIKCGGGRVRVPTWCWLNGAIFDNCEGVAREDFLCAKLALGLACDMVMMRQIRS